MGGIFSTDATTGKASSASVQVRADADTLWSIVSDLQATAEAVEAVQSFQYVIDKSVNINTNSNNSKFQVGTVVQETRAYNGKEFQCRRQIVEIVDKVMMVDSDDDEHSSTNNSYRFRSVSFSTTTDNMPLVSRNVANTSTLTVLPLPCLSGSSSFLPSTSAAARSTTANDQEEKENNNNNSSSDPQQLQQQQHPYCELVGTMAFSSSGGIFTKLALCCWKLCHNLKSPNPLFVKELEDLARAAEKKAAEKEQEQQQQQQWNTTNQNKASE